MDRSEIGRVKAELDEAVKRLTLSDKTTIDIRHKLFTINVAMEQYLKQIKRYDAFVKSLGKEEEFKRFCELLKKEFK